MAKIRRWQHTSEIYRVSNGLTGTAGALAGPKPMVREIALAPGRGRD